MALPTRRQQAGLLLAAAVLVVYWLLRLWLDGR